jgi:hypothetical protein
MGAATFYKRHCIYLPAMAGWFVCSAALSAYNKVGGINTLFINFFQNFVTIDDDENWST